MNLIRKLLSLKEPIWYKLSGVLISTRSFIIERPVCLPCSRCNGVWMFLKVSCWMKWLVAHLFQLELRLPEFFALWYQATQNCNNWFNWFIRSVLNILNQTFVRRAKDKCVWLKLLDRLLPCLKACRLKPWWSRTPITKFSLHWIVMSFNLYLSIKLAK